MNKTLFSLSVFVLAIIFITESDVRVIFSDITVLPQLFVPPHGAAYTYHKPCVI